ncbi:MAG: shikimate dehydrogenase [Bilifractor sp.]|jgi:shikimate dehydrogenase
MQKSENHGGEYRITGHTKLVCLLGSPVAHSLSPLIHNDSFRELGLDYAYLCFDVDEEHLPAAVEGLKCMGVRGFNLTMPDKNRIVGLVDELSPAADLIGACNTVVNDNGRLTGHNTDGVGFIRALADYGFHVPGKNITIMGAGGAASAITAQAALDGARSIRVFARPSSRFHERTVRLVERINQMTKCRATLCDQNDSGALRGAVAESDLLVNATPVGMAPDTERSLIEDPSYFHSGLFVADAIYEPRETKLLRLAREAGCGTANGLYMLLYQGAEAFRLWTGREMPTDLIKSRYFL